MGSQIKAIQVIAYHALTINDNKLSEKRVPWIREICLENLRGKLVF